MPTIRIRYQIDTPYGTWYASEDCDTDQFMATPVSSLDNGLYNALGQWFFYGSYAVGEIDKEIEVRDVQS